MSSPPQLPEYLRPVLSELPAAILSDEAAERHAGELKPDQIERLARLYQAIAQRRDDALISEYLYGVDSNLHDPNYRALKSLQRVFDALAKQQMAPFNSGRVRIARPPLGKPNWDVLPPELRYLGPIAEKYGIWTYPEEIDAALVRLTETEREELKALGKRFTPDRRKLEHWHGEVMIRQVEGMTEAGGHPSDAASYAAQEMSLTTGLKVFLLQGGFTPSRASRQRISPEKLRELADQMEEEERKED